MQNRKSLPQITQSNALVEACYKLTLDEKRLILAAISKIDSRRAIPEKITITTNEFAEAFSIDMKNAYRQLQAAANNLFDREIRLRSEDEDTRLRWLWKKTEHLKNGKVDLHLSSSLAPYLSQLKANFTSYKMDNIKALKSTYSIRLYELFTRYIDTGERWITLEDFRAMLEIEDEYPRFANLKQSVIEPAIKELNKKTNYAVSYTTEKKGRAVHKIWFFFTEKDQLELDV